MVYTYSDLHFYKWMLSEAKKSQPDACFESIEARIVEMKRQIRKRNRDTVSDHVLVTSSDSGDYWITKFPLPEDIHTREEAIEYFKEYEYIYYRPTYYDCTGQTFTSWFKVFQKPDGRFWAYHAYGLDV